MGILINIVSAISVLGLLIGVYGLIKDFSWELVGLMCLLTVSITVLNQVWRG